MPKTTENHINITKTTHFPTLPPLLIHGNITKGQNHVNQTRIQRFHHARQCRRPRSRYGGRYRLLRHRQITGRRRHHAPIGLLIGGVDFSNLFLTLKNGANAPADGYASLAAAQAGGAVTLNLGLFINSIISFLIIASAIFMVVKALNTLKKQEAPAEEAPAEPSEEVLLLREIRDSLKK